MKKISVIVLAFIMAIVTCGPAFAKSWKDTAEPMSTSDAKSYPVYVNDYYTGAIALVENDRIFVAYCDLYDIFPERMSFMQEDRRDCQEIVSLTSYTRCWSYDLTIKDDGIYLVHDIRKIVKNKRVIYIGNNRTSYNGYVYNDTVYVQYSDLFEIFPMEMAGYPASEITDITFLAHYCSLFNYHMSLTEEGIHLSKISYPDEDLSSDQNLSPSPDLSFAQSRNTPPDHYYVYVNDYYTDVIAIMENDEIYVVYYDLYKLFPEMMKFMPADKRNSSEIVSLKNYMLNWSYTSYTENGTLYLVHEIADIINPENMQTIYIDGEKTDYTGYVYNGTVYVFYSDLFDIFPAQMAEYPLSNVTDITWLSYYCTLFNCSQFATEDSINICTDANT